MNNHWSPLCDDKGPNLRFDAARRGGIVEYQHKLIIPNYLLAFVIKVRWIFVCVASLV